MTNNKMTLGDIRNLITLVQTGEGFHRETAKNDLIFEIMEHHMDRHLSNYYGKNTVGGLDNDDMRQIFLMTVSEAIETADPFIGNPLLFILQKGKWAVSDQLKHGYRRNLTQYCYTCNKETKLHSRGGVHICPKCGESDPEKVEVIQMNTHDDGTTMSLVQDDVLNIAEDVAGRMLIEAFRKRLSGRKADIFDMVYYKNYRDLHANYQKAIAAELGIAQANVNLRLRQIKQEWKDFLEEMPLSESELGDYSK